ncbi:MAG: hypothetical protein CGU28_09785 [Candidatus Dactylopiibacterium carminicum]|nr:MAG: hypothetical protein CGU28_09785 [Candidatus Dactylopiibacterium carminicum]
MQQETAGVLRPKGKASVPHTADDIEALMLRSMFWRPTYLALSAWVEHVPFAFWLTEAARPACVVELGTHYGTSYFAFCQAVERLGINSRCFAVDTWKGDEHASIYGEEVFAQVHEHNQAQYSSFSRLVRSTFDEALPHFPDASIDLLHIDGLHTYEAVKHDFESWLPKLSSRAVVVMHDSNVRERGFGVFKFFAELAQRYPHFESAHGHGLGVVGVGAEQTPLMRALYQAGSQPDQSRRVQETFARLGQACAEGLNVRSLQQRLGEQQHMFKREQDESIEQQALSRGALAERITAEVQRNAGLLADYEGMRQQFLQAEAAQAQAQSRLVILEEQSQQLLNEKGELAASLAVQQALYAQEQQRTEQLNGQIQALERQRSEESSNTTESLALLHAQLAESRAARVALETHLVAQTSQLGQLTQAQSELQTRLSQAQAEAAEFSAARDAAQDEVALLRGTLAEQRTRLGALEQQLAAEQSRATELQDAYEAACAENAASQQMIDTLRRINADLHRAWETAGEERIGLQDAADARLAESHRSSAERDAARIECTRLEGALGCAEAQVVDLQTSLDARFGEVAQLIAQLEARAADLQEARLQLAREKQKAARLRRSAAWRLTAPLRWLLGFLDRAPDTALETNIALIRASGLFDEAWYARQLSSTPTGGLEPIAHYLKQGAAKGLSPSSEFDTTAYLARYADVASSGLNPLVHYIRHGRAEGRLTF